MKNTQNLTFRLCRGTDTEQESAKEYMLLWAKYETLVPQFKTNLFLGRTMGERGNGPSRLGQWIHCGRICSKKHSCLGPQIDQVEIDILQLLLFVILVLFVSFVSFLFSSYFILSIKELSKESRTSEGLHIICFMMLNL